MAPLALSSKLAVPFTARGAWTVPFTAQAPRARPSRRTTVAPVAALDPSAALAVSQQVAAYAAVVGGEAAYTGLNTPATTPGRPSVPITLIVAGGTIAAAVLVGQGDSSGTIGCAIGFGVAAFNMVTLVQRFKDTPFNPNDWPGAKAWPAVMMLITFFELAATQEGLFDAFGLLRQP